METSKKLARIIVGISSLGFLYFLILDFNVYGIILFLFLIFFSSIRAWDMMD